RIAVHDLSDGRPKNVEGSAIDPLIARVENELKSFDWVDDAQVRLWTAGHVFFGDAQVVARNESGLREKIKKATEHILALDWRMHEIAIVPVGHLGELEEEGIESVERERGRG
ncbi:MAG: hypothetical protein ACRDLB_06800, partial [Actinomycetota bacterium]